MNKRANSDIVQPPGEAAAASFSATLATVGLIVFMAIGLVSSLQPLFAEDAEPLPTFTKEEALDGTASRAVAALLAKTPLPELSARWQRAGGWLLTRDLGGQVREGCPGWLFLAEELAIRPDAAANASARADVVRRVHAALAARNIELVVAVVPDKTRIMAAQRCQLVRPAVLATRAADWVGALRADGINALDLASSLENQQEAVFLQADTHWNEQGAHLAASQIAGQVHSQGLTPEQQTVIELGEAHQRPGDLVRLAGLDWLPANLQPAHDEVRTSSFHVAPVAAGASDNDDDLFGDAGLPTVALIGSSFSRTSAFADFLAHELHTPVANFGKDGGAFSGAAHDYFDSQAFKQTPPRLIIWEIPERSLDAALTDDLSIWNEKSAG